MKIERKIEVRDGTVHMNCKTCGKMLPAEEFDTYKGRGGTVYYVSECKDCRRERNMANAIYRTAKKRGISVEQVLEERAISLHRQLKRIEDAEEAKKAKVDAREFNTANKANICFDCANACGGCSWTAVDDTRPGKPIKYEPVPGWTAEPVFRTVSNQIIKTYAITDCPQFVPDRREK